MYRITLSLGALLAVYAMPAVADEGWDLVNRTYLEGNQQGTSPVTTDEMLSCGAFWNVWSAVLDGSNFSEAELAGLVPQLRPDAALMVSRAYIPDLDKVEEGHVAELEGYLAEASDMFDAYLYGDNEAGGTFFAMLGVCHPRAEAGSAAQEGGE